MPKWLICAATSTSGVRHRFMTLSRAKHYADSYGYSLIFLWGVTKGVAYCRFDEVFAPLPGVKVIDVPTEYFDQLAASVRDGQFAIAGRERFRLFVPGQHPKDTFFCWDLGNSIALSRMCSTPRTALIARPAAGLRARADAYIKEYDIANRLGIRVRVEEFPFRDRKPHRVKRELDATLKSLIRIPWYAKIFVATDSEYVQQTLACHFVDTAYLPKSFDLHEPTGCYVHRLDKDAIKMFLLEVECLCRCKKIVNIGGFLNDAAVSQRVLQPPYTDAALMHLSRR